MGEKCCWFIAFIPDGSPEILITSSSPLPLCHLISSAGISANPSQNLPGNPSFHRVLWFWFLPSHSSLELLITSQGKKALRASGLRFPGSLSCCLCTAWPNSAKSWRNQCPDTGRSKYVQLCKVGWFFQWQFRCPNYTRVDNSPHTGQ